MLTNHGSTLTGVVAKADGQFVMCTVLQGIQSSAFSILGEQERGMYCSENSIAYMEPLELGDTLPANYPIYLLHACSTVVCDLTLSQKTATAQLPSSLTRKLPCRCLFGSCESISSLSVVHGARKLLMASTAIPHGFGYLNLRTACQHPGSGGPGRSTNSLSEQFARHRFCLFMFPKLNTNYIIIYFHKQIG